MKATAVAPANIALIKYWGKADEKLRLPLNDSISMNLSGAHTTTTVEFSDALTADEIPEALERERIVAHLDRIRSAAGMRLYATVTTRNSFPAAAGIASSASGFAALTLAGVTAAGLTMSEKELSILARMGSGSACRSIPDGFVLWEKGNSSGTSFARSLYPASYWDIRDILVIVSDEEKKIKSSAGMRGATTSPRLAARLSALPARIEKIRHALQHKDFAAFGSLVEEDCLDMHAVMQSQNPPLNYWSDETKKIMEDVKKRELPAYVTVDAGPNVHILCEAKDEARVVKRYSQYTLIINKPAHGAHLL